MDADVAVIGVGTMGSFALWQLAARGASVLGIEQFEPGHDRGSGHGESRIFRTAYAEGAEYVPFLQAALPLWRRLEDESGESLLLMTGGLMIGSPESDFLRGVRRSIEEHHLPHTVLNGSQTSQLYPQHRMRRGDVMVYERLAGVISPERSIRAAAARAEELGATIVAQTRVRSIEPASDGVRVSTADRAYHVRHAIVSVGAWTGKLLSRLAPPLWVERQVMVWFTAYSPEKFTPERFPIFMYDHGGESWYGFPSLEGATVKVALHHFGGKESNPDALDREIHPEDLTLISQLVREHLPDLNPDPVSARVCMYTNTPDERFVIGPAPGMPNVTVVGGMSGHGFKFAPIMGRIAAELALDGEASMPIGRFSPERFSPGTK